MSEEPVYYDKSKIFGRNGALKTFCGKKRQLKGPEDEPFPTSIEGRQFVGGYKEGSCKNCCYNCKQICRKKYEPQSRYWFGKDELSSIELYIGTKNRKFVYFGNETFDPHTNTFTADLAYEDPNNQMVAE